MTEKQWIQFWTYLLNPEKKEELNVTKKNN